jgi:hypothetical protein
MADPREAPDGAEVGIARTIAADLRPTAAWITRSRASHGARHAISAPRTLPAAGL